MGNEILEILKRLESKIDDNTDDIKEIKTKLKEIKSELTEFQSQFVDFECKSLADHAETISKFIMMYKKISVN